MKRFIVIALEKLCEAVDVIPYWERTEGRWHRYRGTYGHIWKYFQPSLWSAALDERWQTGVWKEPSEQSE